MSGLAGVLWLDWMRRATVEDVARPLRALSHRGPDGLFAATSGPCGLGIARYDTTPQARIERQPHHRAALTVTLDGRLDNGDELRCALAAAPHQLVTDVEVVAAAWEKWGVTSLARLLGDFAIAVWDARERRLYLARDAFGLRPLLYRWFRNGMWWASELQALARLGDACVNEGMIAEYLADAVSSESETLVQGVLRVPRASVVTVTDTGDAHISSYWSPAGGAARPRADEEIVEEFRALFREAVRARVRSDREIAISLSGGLDSSLVAAEAAALAQTGRGPAVCAFTLSLPLHPADESKYARAVADHLRLSSQTFPYSSASLDAIQDDAARALEFPMAPNCTAAAAMNDAIRARDVRVCLNGVGGNEWFSGYAFTLADQFRRLELVGAWKRLRALRRQDPSYSTGAALRLALWLQLPEAAKKHLRQALGLPRAPARLQPEFAARTALTERIRARRGLPELPTMQQRLMFAWAVSAANMFVTEYTERVSASVPSEERMPFLDRRLVEWALGLPDDHRRRGDITKVVLRHAADGVLPSIIVRRERGPDFSFLTAVGLEQIGGWPLLRAIAAERAAWIKPDAVAELWQTMAGEQHTGAHHSWPLWLLVGTHLAARAIEDCRPLANNVIGVLPVATMSRA